MQERKQGPIGPAESSPHLTTEGKDPCGLSPPDVKAVIERAPQATEALSRHSHVPNHRYLKDLNPVPRCPNPLREVFFFFGSQEWVERPSLLQGRPPV